MRDSDPLMVIVFVMIGFAALIGGAIVGLIWWLT
jgi:hypothetical protein